LGSHLLDQAISLYGKPLQYHKTLGKYRPDTQVDDYAHLHLIYPNQLNVFITVSMLAADPQAGIVVHGTRGSFIKSFCDTQEEQLQKGLLPGDNDFGKEPEGHEGRLTIINENGEKEMEMVPSETGRYMDVFSAAFKTIRNGKPFPVTQEDILTQLEILESPVK
jgi:predicted dehydrogenase